MSARARLSADAVRCPLCGARENAPSWLGSTVHAGHTYVYVECQTCHSLFCDPMPSVEVLAQLYGSDYQGVLADHAEGGEREIARVVQYLSDVSRGTFVDYGCGQGRLLQEAERLGWTPVGVEFDDAVAASVAGRIGLPVIGLREAQVSLAGRVDVLHLGDVIEHLTALDEQMPAILRLLAPGGVLLAQGPLENNANFFTAVLRLLRSAGGRRVSAMPPYHVLLATGAGQKRLFERCGLIPLEFEMTEVAWPAPQRLRDARGLRRLVMFLLRQMSMFASRLRPRDWGNRYFFVGQRS